MIIFRYKGILKNSLKCEQCREVNNSPDLIINFTQEDVYFACGKCSFKNRLIRSEFYKESN